MGQAHRLPVAVSGVVAVAGLVLAKVPRSRLETAWQTYRAIRFGSISPRTRQEYTTCAKRALADLPPVITLECLIAWRDALGALLDFCTAYVNLHVHVLRTVSRRAALVTGDRELEALVWLLEPLREHGPTVRAPPPDFLLRVLGAARNLGEAAWLLLAGLCGLRKGELLGLRPSDYDRDTGVLRVERQRHAEHRKNWLPHSVHVTDRDLHCALVWSIDNRDALRPRFGSFRGKSDGYLFPWAERYLELFLSRIRDHLGADAHAYLPAGVGWHHWRRWGATQKARAGASVWEILRWLCDRGTDMAQHYVDVERGAAESLTL